MENRSDGFLGEGSDMSSSFVCIWMSDLVHSMPVVDMIYVSHVEVFRFVEPVLEAIKPR